MELVEQLKRHVAKRSIQRSFNNQILDSIAILDLSEDKTMSIKFFRIFFGISFENLEIEKWYDDRDTVPVTRSSHHLVILANWS